MAGDRGPHVAKVELDLVSHKWSLWFSRVSSLPRSWILCNPLCSGVYSCYLFSLFETGSQVSQAGIKLAMYPRITLNSWSSWVYFSRDEITGVCHRTQHCLLFFLVSFLCICISSVYICVCLHTWIYFLKINLHMGVLVACMSVHHLDVWYM